MPYNYYRFHLLDNNSFSRIEQFKDKLKYLFLGKKELAIVRVSADLISPNKSISFISTKDTSTMQSTVSELLLAEGITISPQVDTEALEEILPHTHEHHHQCSHSSHEHPSDVPNLATNSPPKQAQKEKPHTHDHGHSHHGHDHGHSHVHDNHWLKAGLGLASGAGLLILSLTGFTLPLIAYGIITALTTLMTLYLGRTVYQAAWKAIRQKKWDTSILYSISTLTIVGVSIASLFIPSLPLMFEAAPLVLGFWHLGEGIEHTLIEQITEKLDVRDCVSPQVTIKGDPDHLISVKQLIPNDIIIIPSGSVIPVDGILTTPALLYTTRINGSPSPKEFQVGDRVKAGMRLADQVDPIEMQVSKTYQNSYLSIIAHNIDKANNEKAPIELFANKLLKYFIPGLLTVAAISGLIIATVFTPPLAIQCIIAVLVSACPCALSLITPLAVKIGLKKASDNGIQFNNGKALQAAADIDTVVFDLNGTLTKGNIEVRKLHISDTQYLAHIALLQSYSTHPVARIIKSYINAQPLPVALALEANHIDKSHHSGVKGVINGELFIIGNKDMLSAQGIQSFPKPYDDPKNGSIYIVRGQTVIGQVALDDPLRDDAVATVKELKRLGKTIHICTGADQDTAEQYAELLGISKKNICANTVGVKTRAGEVSKTSYIRQLKAKGHKVSMIGDAANDLPAIAYSNIGIAVKSSIGDEVTQQHAGIVVQKGLLFPIASAFDTAKKTKRNIIQNLALSLTYNSAITLVAAGLFVALGFTLNPALGVALMIVESTVILANLYRFKQQKIVSAPAESEQGVFKEKESATSKMLHAFGLNPKPKSSCAVKPEMTVTPKKTPSKNTNAVENPYGSDTDTYGFKMN